MTRAAEQPKPEEDNAATENALIKARPCRNIVLVITLHQFDPAYGHAVSVSPFCANVELYLRLTGREYKTAPADLWRSPNRMVPFVQYANGERQAESGDIISRLETESPTLSAQPAIDDLLQDVHDKLYFGVLYSRFGDPAGWHHQRASVAAIVPGWTRFFSVPLIRRLQVRKCARNGFSSAADYQKSVPVLAKLEARLGKGTFFSGDAPGLADCRLWGHLVGAATGVPGNPIYEATRASKPLMEYVTRVAERAGLRLSL